MTLLVAGNGEVSAVGDWNEDYVATEGLGNCIAVIGTNVNGRRIAIAHYDTVRANLPDGLDVATERLIEFRQWFQQRTNTNQFHVGIGLGWRNPSAYRPTLLHACDAAFGGWPRQLGAAIYFFRENNQFFMQASSQLSEAVSPQNVSTAIPYDNLVPKPSCSIM